MITINDKEYAADDLTDEQKGLVNQINNCRAKAQAAAAELQIAQVAEHHFSQALIASVESPE